jgi:hypothetical protein
MKFCYNDLLKTSNPFEQNSLIMIAMDKMTMFLNWEIGQETPPHFPVQKPITWTRETLKKLYIAITKDGYARSVDFSENELTSLFEHGVLSYCPFLPLGCEKKGNFFPHYF